MSSETIFRTSLLEENDGPGHNPTDNRSMGEIIASRFSRRGFLKGSLAVSAIAATVSPMALMLADEARAQAGASAFTFDEVEAGVDANHHVAAGYDADVLLRWGDPIFADAPEFDPTKQSAEAQARQFGYNNDFVGYHPARWLSRAWPARRQSRIHQSAPDVPRHRQDRRKGRQEGD